MENSSVVRPLRVRLRTADGSPPPGDVIAGFATVAVAVENEDADDTLPAIIWSEYGCDNLPQMVAAESAQGERRVLVITPAGSAVDAWHLLAAGACDVLAWQDASTPRSIAARLSRWCDVDRLQASPLVAEQLAGTSAAWRGLVRRIIEVAAFTDAAILVTGESGTGKELVARLIHALDRRLDKRDLVVLDCATVVPELSGSEFFGHERGAFTGSIGPRDGAFALADRGTLFLDEIGELPLPLQAQLLRVVQEQTYKRVGANSWQHTRFRLVCATNRDLALEVERRRFRADLFHRISTWTFHLPPLRQRPEDVLPTARHLLGELQPGLTLDPALESYLVRRSFPGNVRELRQLMTRLVSRHVGEGPLTVGDLPEEERPEPDAPPPWPDAAFTASVRRALAIGVGLRAIGREASETAIRVALEEAGSVQGAARRLGVTDRALQMRRAARD